ncbi:aminotransferase class I/II-fold pyridoxal phosphate-dependent enzyme [Tautonia sp. JC769]|uniref:pyridoxal phosphate-dependent aminotransferase n=1 Tax=Tautonia sp. JC769 TaxID=3232135 RepID=UPI00345A2BBF
MNDGWIADRMTRIEASGIRKAFEMARQMTGPINLSIGLPDFDVPEVIKDAACEAIRGGRNAYTVTMGDPGLRGELQQRVDETYGHADRQVMVTSGTAGGLLLAICCAVNPGDEVIVFDPYFVMYPNLVALAGGTTVLVETYPSFGVPIDRVEAAITAKTKAIIVNSPGNPSGVVVPPADLEALAELCKDRGVLLISDEVYKAFCYDESFHSPAEWNEDVLVVDGFSKTYGMTGWRLGFAHGPGRLMQEMAKLQQFSFVCAPTPLQHAVVGASKLDLTGQIDAYRRKRDRVIEALSGRYELARPTGAFYAFPKVPEGWPSATVFVEEAIRRNLLVIPGNVFSKTDSHVRISYAVDDAVLERGLEVLRSLAEAPGGATA